MGRALKEIGWRRALRYAWLEVALIIERLLVFPPLRALWLGFLGATIGRGALLMDVRFTNADRTGFAGLEVGESAYLGRGVRLDLAERITLGEHVTLGDEVLILTHTNVGFADHPLQEAFPASTSAVQIERGAYLGARALILPGVTIGKRAFVAAGAIVTKSVAPGDIVRGQPARVVGHVDERQPSS